MRCAQARCKCQPETATVQQFRHQLVGTWHQANQPQRCLPCQHGGQAFGLSGAQRVNWRARVLPEHSPVQEEQSAEGLILGGGRHVLCDGQMGEESFDLCATHLPGMLLVMKEDKAPDPVHVGLFGMDGVMLEPDDLTHLIDFSDCEGAIDPQTVQVLAQ